MEMGRGASCSLQGGYLLVLADREGQSLYKGTIFTSFLHLSCLFLERRKKKILGQHTAGKHIRERIEVLQREIFLVWFLPGWEVCRLAWVS